MNRKVDLIVVGGGLSGMTAAAFAARKGKKCILITKGNGTITIGSGTIDVLGYLPNGKPVSNPFEAVTFLPKRHPYQLIGELTVRNALKNFSELVGEENVIYKTRSQKNTYVVTAAGTIKPTWMVTESMDMSIIPDIKNICILGIEGMKDFYPELIIKGLSSKKYFANKTFTQAKLHFPESERNISTFNVAQYLEIENGLKWLVQGIKQQGNQSDLIILPPILGTTFLPHLLHKLEQKSNCLIRECDVLPPTITGYRLNILLRYILKKYHVTIIDNAAVTSAEVKDNHCISVITTQNSNIRKYEATHFIIATGGIISNGILTKHNRAWEPIFNIDLPANPSSPDWANKELYPKIKKSHLFSMIGPTVDSFLRPTDSDGNPICDNVFFIGNTLNGYDSAYEKSGNGVAISTAYFASLNV